MALAKIKQYSLFKEVMDRNSAMFGVSAETLSYFDYSPEVHSSLYQNKFKTIDCKMIHNIFQCWKRQKMMLKVKNDRFVFIERTTLSSKTLKKINRARAKDQPQNSRRLDADPQDFKSGALAHAEDVEESRLREKRARNMFKKLYHLNITRTLRILGYLPSQSDERKFLHSNYKEHMIERARDKMSFGGS